MRWGFPKFVCPTLSPHSVCGGINIRINCLFSEANICSSVTLRRCVSGPHIRDDENLDMGWVFFMNGFELLLVGKYIHTKKRLL